MNPLIAELEREQVVADRPRYHPGDTVRIHTRVIEGQRERIQVFEGVVLKVNSKQLQRSVTVRRLAAGIGVERTFLADSPRIEKIEVIRHGKVRRARLYYLRDRVGKKAKIKERRFA